MLFDFFDISKSIEYAIYAKSMVSSIRDPSIYIARQKRCAFKLITRRYLELQQWYERCHHFAVLWRGMLIGISYLPITYRTLETHDFL